jgi:hypothetical protein
LEISIFILACSKLLPSAANGIDGASPFDSSNTVANRQDERSSDFEFRVHNADVVRN